MIPAIKCTVVCRLTPNARCVVAANGRGRQKLCHDIRSHLAIVVVGLFELDDQVPLWFGIADALDVRAGQHQVSIRSAECDATASGKLLIAVTAGGRIAMLREKRRSATYVLKRLKRDRPDPSLVR